MRAEVTRRRNEEMKKRLRDLPTECWEMILSLVGDHKQLESVSLVSKLHLSITNELRTHLTITEPTFLVHGTFSHLFNRFQNLTSISLVEFCGDLNKSLVEIANSDLKIETLNISKNNALPIYGLARLGKKKNILKVLICSHLKILNDTDLAAIANLFPLLEELDISYPLEPHIITETGIEYLASRVTNLRKIDISGNQGSTDKSISALFSNCLLLTEIKFLDSPNISVEVFQFLFQNRNPLISSVQICSKLISDDLLLNISKAGFPLKKLTLFSFQDLDNFTFSSLSILLQAYHSLEYLSLNNLNFLDDSSMDVVSTSLPCLVKITIKGCFNLNMTDSTLFLLAKNCPLLEHIEMEVGRLGKRKIIPKSFVNTRIKHLNLTMSVGLIDRRLIQLSSVCTKLESLNLFYCPRISNKGLERVLNNCTEISHLSIVECKKLKSIGMGGMLKNMKFLNAGMSGINNNGLTMIGTRCSELVRLNVWGCKKISDDGVTQMVRNCKKLKALHMSSTNVSRECFNWIVNSMPWLMKVIPPCDPPFAFDSNRSKLPLKLSNWER